MPSRSNIVTLSNGAPPPLVCAFCGRLLEKNPKTDWNPTGAGYQGVKQDAELKASVAVWRLPRLAPKDEQALTVTLSRAVTWDNNMRGNVKWTKPTVKTGPFDQANIGVAPPTQTN